MKKERKAIKAGSQLFYQAIYNQAGSVEKAFLEYVMNAADSGAKKIEITLANNGIDYTIFDDGDGFGDPTYSYEEKVKCIEPVFGFLGFDHGKPEDNHRIYGKFGIGRAQLWSFSSNNWFTHNISMEVDVKNRGKDWDIKETNEFVDGCRIEGKFYDPIPMNDIGFISNQLAKMCAFAPLDVYFNGKKISRPLNELKHDLGVKGVRANLKPSGELFVYNQGVFVRSFITSEFGFGGIICSDVGSPFEVNTARNDIIRHKCTLWQKVRDALGEKLRKRMHSERETLSDCERQGLLMRIIGGDIEEAKFAAKKPLLKMANNRYISIEKLLKEKHFTCILEDQLSHALDGATNIIQEDKDIPVIQMSFIKTLGNDIKSIKSSLEFIQSHVLGDEPSDINLLSLEDMVEHLQLDLTRREISDRKTTKRHQLFLETLNDRNLLLKLGAIAYEHEIIPDPETILDYTIKLGESETHKCWLGDNKEIFLSTVVSFDKITDKHYGCMTNIYTMILKTLSEAESEYSEDEVEYYQNLHEAMVRCAVEMFDLSVEFIREFSGRLVNNNFVVPNRLVRSLKNSDLQY